MEDYRILQFPEDFLNKIICGDCLEVLKYIPDNSIDLVFTDPPYNISEHNKKFRDYRSGKNGDITMDFGEWDYNFDPIPFLEESKRVLNEFGSIVVWMSEQQCDIYGRWFRKEMHPKQILVWVKTNPLPQFRLIGYRQATELMYWALKNKNTKRNPNFIFLSQKEMLNVFYAPIVGGKERIKDAEGKTLHPTQKPLSVTREIIKRHCRVGGIILDPFAGVGTTCVAAKELNRNFIGIEIDPKFCEAAKQRLSQVQPNLFAHIGENK